MHMHFLFTGWYCLSIEIIHRKLVATIVAPPLQQPHTHCRCIMFFYSSLFTYWSMELQTSKLQQSKHYSLHILHPYFQWKGSELQWPNPQILDFASPNFIKYLLRVTEILRMLNLGHMLIGYIAFLCNYAISTTSIFGLGHLVLSPVL